MDTVEEAAKRRGLPKWLVPVFGCGISILSLIWVLPNFHLAQIADDLHRLDWNWVAVAVVIELGVYLVDAWRWMVILRPAGAPPFLNCLQAVFVGILANDILPAKTGEALRCFLLSYESKVPLSLALISDVVLRVMDGLWILIFYLIIKTQMETPYVVDGGVWLVGGTMIPAGLVIVWVLFHRNHAHRFLNKSKWAARFLHLLEEIHRLGHWRELGTAMAIGSLYWVVQALAIWAICRADNFYFGANAVMYILTVKTVATVVPGAPANVGLYQSAVIYAATKTLYSEPGPANSLAEIMFVVLTLPLIVGGAVAIASAGFNLKDLHRHAHEAHSRGKRKVKGEAPQEGD